MITSPTAKTPCLPRSQFCANGRRGFLQAGLAGFATLSLPGILRLQAQNALHAAESAQRSRKEGGDHGLAAGRAVAPGLVRSQAGRRQRVSRPVFDDCDEGAGPALHRAAAAAGRHRRQVHGPAVDAADGGRPPGRFDAVALRRPRHARQAEAATTRLDVGGQLPVARKRPARRTRCRRTSASTRRWNTTAPRTWATPIRRSSSRAIPNPPTFSVPNIGLSDADEVRRLGRPCDAAAKPRHAGAELRPASASWQPSTSSSRRR